MAWRKYVAVSVLVGLAVAHAAFAWSVRGKRPELAILTDPPSALGREAMSFGDHQFFYRTSAFDLFNAGDTGGRATRMVDYNYDQVIGWLETLRALDPHAHQHPMMALRYFGQTPDKADVRRIVEFVAADARGDMERKWFWMAQAAEAAHREFNDLPYALALAQELAAHDFPDMPSWVWTLPAVLLEKLGRKEEALAVLARVNVEKAPRLAPQDFHWIKGMEDRLAKS